MKYYIIVLFFVIISCTGNIFGQCKATINGDTKICQGDLITLKSDQLGNWYSSEDKFATSKNNNSKDFTVNPSGTTIYKFLEKNCKDSLKVTITVNPLPNTPSFNYTQNKCSNELVEFTNTTSGSGLSYSWNFGGATSSLINPTYTFPTSFGNATTPYDVTLEVKNPNGCINTLTKSVIVKQIPDPNIQNFDIKSFTNCGAGDYKLKVSDKSTTKSSNTHFEIDWGDGSTKYIGNNFPDPSEHTYTKKGYSYLIYKILGQNGCSNEIKKTVFNGTNPSVGLSNPGGTVNLCVSKELIFPITSSNGNPPGTTYLLETNTGKPSVTYSHPPPNSYNHNFDSTSCGASGGTTQNSYFVRIKAENPCGFSYSTIEPITTSIKPKADFKQNPDKKACKNTTVTFTNTSKEGVIVDNYGICDKTTINNWIITPNSGWNLLSGSKLGDDSPTLDPDTWGSDVLLVRFTNPGTYNISMIVRNSCGNDTITKPYCIQSPPTPSYTATPKKGCSPLVSNFTNTSTNINQCDTVTRQWIVSKVKTTCDKDSTLDYRFISGTSETSMNPVIRFNNEGEYNVTLQLTNMCGVFTSSTETFVVGRKPKLSISVPSNICFGESIKPTANTQDCGNTISSFNWTFSNATPVSANTIIAPTINYATAGTKTISLEATNSCGTSKESATIDVLNPPIVDAGQDQKMCTGETITIGSTALNGLTYSWSPSTGLSNSTNSKPTLTLTNNTNAPINFKYVLTATNLAACKNKDSLIVTVNPLPNLTITPSKEICEKKSISLTASGADSYIWTPSSTLNSATGASVTATPLNTTIYSVVGTNNTTNCKNTISTTITVNTLPIVNAGVDQNLCNQPIPIKIQAISTGGSWSGSNITTDGTFTPNGVGSTKAFYSITDSKGCENKDSILINVKNPQAAEAGNDVSECLYTSNKTLNGTPIGGTWNGSTIVSSNGILSFSQAGSFKLYYTIGTGSCITKDSLNVTIKSLPIVNAGTDLTKCINDPDFNLSGTPTGGTWSGIGVSGTGLFSPNTAKAGIKTITYTYNDPVSNCSNKDDLLITINDITVVNAGVDTSVCNQPIPFNLIGNPKNGTWSGSGITSNGKYTPSGVGTFTVTYSFTNTFGCINSDNRIIDVNNPTIAEAGNDINKCLNDQSITLTGTPIGGTWSGSSLVTPNGVLTFSQSGTNKLFYTIGAGSCKTKDSIQVLIKSLPIVNAGSDLTKCINDVDFNLTGSPIGGTWSGTGVTSIGLFSPNTAKAGVKTITYTYTDATTSCINNDDIVITVNDITPVNAGIDTTVCNQPIPFKVVGTPSLGVWSGIDVTTNGIFTPNATGNTTLTYTYKNAFNCSSSDTRVIKVINPTDAEAGPDASICIDTASIQLTGSPSNGIWNGNSNVSQSGIFKPQTAGNFKLFYNYGAGSCARKDSLTVNVKSLPVIVASNDTAICVNGGSITLKSSPSGGNWSGSGIDKNSGVFSPQNTGKGDFKLVYQFKDLITSCKNSEEVKISVNDTTKVDAGQDTTVCNQPFQIQFIGQPIGGKWSGSNITTDGKFTPNGIGKNKVTYSYTNAFHCTTFDEKIIEVINPTLADAGNSIAICVDTIGIQLSGIPSNGNWTGTGISSLGFFTPTTSGDFKVFYHFGSGACATTDSLIMTVNALPTLNLINDFSSCINSSIIKLTATPLNGYWLGKGADSTGNFNAAISGLGISKIKYNFRDPSTKCFNTKELQITIHDTTTLFVGSDTTLCNQPFPVQLTANPVGGNWSGTNITSTGLYTPTTLGDFVVTYAYSNTFNCKNKIQKKISIITPIQANAGKDDSICYDQKSKQLTGIPNNGIWTGQNINSNGIFTRTNPGNFFNIYSYGAGNCLTRDTMKLIVHSLPIVHAGNDKSFCGSDQAYNFNGLPIGGKWRGPGITDEVNGTFDPTKVIAGKHNLIYSYLDIKTGCSNEDTLIATVNPLPIIDFILKPILCIDVEEQIINNTQFHGNSSWDFGNQTISSLENPKIKYSNIGTYKIKLVETSPFGCIDSLSKIIHVWDPPKAIFTIDKDSLCSPALVTISQNAYGSGLKYNWDFGNSKLDTVPSPPPITYLQGIIADTIYNLKLSVSNLCGTSSLIRKVKVMPIPTAMFHTNVSSGCTPLPIDFYNKTLGLPKQFNWDFGNGTSTTKDSLFQRVFTTDSVIKTFNVKLIAINSCGSDTIIKSIIVKPNTINAFFNVDKNEGCNDLSIKFTENSIGQTFSSWDFGDGSKTTEKNPTHLYTKAGNYIAKLYITNGCSFDTASVKINVLPSPIIDFTSSSDSLCLFGIFNFKSFTKDTVSIVWDFGDSTNSFYDNTDHMYLKSGSFLVELKATNMKNGCVTKKTEKVYVHKKPIANFEMDTTQGCVPLTINFINKSIEGKFFAWDFDDGNSSNQKELKHTYTKSGNLKVQLIIESEYGCKDTLVKNINPFPIPTIDFNYTMSDPCYSPLFVSFTNNSSGANNYVWTFGNGTQTTTTNPDTKYTQAGKYSVSLSGSNTYNCNVVSKKNIIVNQKPDADFELSVINGCMPLTVEITNNSKFSNFYNWNLGDGNSSNTKDPKHIFTKDGKYDISLITENNEGCKDTVTKSILVYPLPIASFSLQNSNPCFQPMIVSANNTSIGAINYLWDFGNGISSLLTHPTISHNTVGNHPVILKAQNEYGCENIAKQFIRNYNTPKLTPNLLPSGFCEHDQLFYSINSLFINKISWDMGNGKINTGASFNYVYPKQGNYTITVIGEGEGGCADTLELNQKISVNPDPVADFSHSPIKYDELLNGSVEYQNNSTQADDYQWRFGDGNTSELISPTHKFYNSGDYTTTLIAFNKFKCVDSITKKIHVDFFKGLYVPNAIYLGHSDKQIANFIPKGVGMFEYEITIFDDWGNLIWRSTALDEYGRPVEYWDGTYKGEYVQQDSYVWKVNAIFRDNSIWEGKKYEKSVYNRAGTVTVIR